MREARSRKGVATSVPPRNTRMRPPCSTTKARLRSPAGTWKSRGFERPRTTRVVVSVGWPPTGVAEQPTGDVDALGVGVGLPESVPQPLIARTTAAAANVFDLRGETPPSIKCPVGSPPGTPRRAPAPGGAALTDSPLSGPARGLGEDPEGPHEQVGQVAVEGGRALLVHVVAHELEDPPHHEQREGQSERDPAPDGD